MLTELTGGIPTFFGSIMNCRRQESSPSNTLELKGRITECDLGSLIRIVFALLIFEPFPLNKWLHSTDLKRKNSLEHPHIFMGVVNRLQIRLCACCQWFDYMSFVSWNNAWLICFPKSYSRRSRILANLHLWTRYQNLRDKLDKED